MKDKNKRNGLIYFLVVVVTIVVYIVIHFYCNELRMNIYKENDEYANNLNKQPINNIIAKKEEIIERIPVNKIKLSINNITMTIGNKRRIIAIVEPYNATNKSLIWESSDPSIATVDKNGNIVAIKEGVVTITVKTKDGEVIETCKVTVKTIEVDEIMLNPTTMTIKVNSSASIVAVVKPDDAIYEGLIWESSDPSIATVDKNGRVTGIKVGKVTITARTPDGKVKATCVVNVITDTIAVSNIKVNPSKISIKIGSSSQLLAIIEPENATERDVVWTSSDKNVVTVDSNGKITGVKIGTATITVKTKDGTKEATCIVEVEPIKVDKIILDASDITVLVDESEQITAYIEPENATNQELIWTSSDPSIATVDDTGKVTGVKVGEVIITVKTKDGKVTATCKVTVDKFDDSIVFTYDYNQDNYIYLINQFPTKDETGKNLQGEKHTNDFKIRFNEEAVGVKYFITVEKLDGSTLDEKWAKLFLVNDGVDVQNCYRTSGRIKSFDEYKEYKNKQNEKILYEGVISSSEASRGYKDFTFRMWVSEDLQLINSNYLSETKTFNARINVYAVK